MKKFYTKYNLPMKVSSPSGEISLTDSQFLPDCDINVIMKRCASGDTSLIRAPSAGVFADVSDIGGFADCMSKMIEARRQFQELPSAIRKRFGNDPSLLISFLSDSANDEEAISLGLKVRPEVPDPVKVEVVSSIIEATAEKGGQEVKS